LGFCSKNLAFNSSTIIYSPDELFSSVIDSIFFSAISLVFSDQMTEANKDTGKSACNFRDE
jgi:hypothetical protein